MDARGADRSMLGYGLRERSLVVVDFAYVEEYY
jgi:hypothetical protein